MATIPETIEVRATLDDLMREEGKAELIGGRIVRFMGTGHRPNRVAFQVARSLDDHAHATGRGVVYTDGIGFVVPELSSGRESFSPDVSHNVGPSPANEMDFVPGAPTYAVEVRSKSDRGTAAEASMAAKRADYFEAGTLVVWDVDIVAGTIRSYRSDAPDSPNTFGPGDRAEAGPAVAGWSIKVDEMFLEMISMLKFLDRVALEAPGRLLCLGACIAFSCFDGWLARRGAPRFDREGTAWFRRTAFFRAAMATLLILVFLAGSTLLRGVRGDPPNRALVRCLSVGTLVLMACLLAWPMWWHAIGVSAGGIIERSFWRDRRRIAWPDIEKIDTIYDGSVVVKVRNGRPIGIPRQLNGIRRLREFCRPYMPLTLVEDDVPEGEA